MVLAAIWRRGKKQAPIRSEVGLDQQALEVLIGIHPTFKDNVLKFSLPRKDVRVTVDGFDIIPFMGLTSWVAFRKGTEHATVMGDLVLLEDEVGPAVASAVDANLYVTALHNHFIRQEPSVLFMHVEATVSLTPLPRYGEAGPSPRQ